MVFVLLGGFGVLFATLQTTSEERTRESALMRAIGASRNYLKGAYLVEYGLIGLISGIIGVLAAEAIVAVLYHRVLDLGYSPSLLLWLLVPAGSALLVSVAGYWGGQRGSDLIPYAFTQPVRNHLKKQ
jgi:Predicted ABC-type transport system involved in lysophospholipase L1 biosynthesis, permease component